jgi:flagellar basal-body rod modification protein FlgD
MSTSPVNAASSASQAANQNTSSTNSFQSLTAQDFLNMMVAELQNQDPTNPTDSSQILQEVSQIDAIQSNTQLTTTLQGVQLGQSIATASALIGMSVVGTDANGNSVSGTVSSASINNGAAQLQIGSSSIPLSNVTQVDGYGSSSSSSSGS